MVYHLGMVRDEDGLSDGATGRVLGAKDNQQKGYTKGEQAILINACYWLTER